MKLSFAIMLVAITATVFSQTREPGELPPDAPPLEYPNEPPYYAYYRYAAAHHANEVTSATDVIRNFQQSQEFKDAFTSPALQQKYEDMITSQGMALGAMRRDLLTTATTVNRVASEQLQNMRDLYKLRAPEFGGEQ